MTPPMPYPSLSGSFTPSPTARRGASSATRPWLPGDHRASSRQLVPVLIRISERWPEMVEGPKSAGLKRDPLLSVAEAAELLGTGVRFPRRLIAERRIRYVKVGRHVRIPEFALQEFLAAQTVEPLERGRLWGHSA